MIKFEKRIVKSKFRSPRKNFGIDEQEIEFRKDPLTGRWCRININRVKRFRNIKKDGFLKEMIKESKVNCPFCEENIDRTTSKFIETDRLKLGDSIIFPNLFPYSKNHGVVVLSVKKHYLHLNEISSKLLFDSLKNSINFFKFIYSKDKKSKYPSINFNFMPPAAASIFHPHFQVILDDKPTYFTNLLIKKSLVYYKRYGSNFWFDLIKAERKNKERFIGKNGDFYWIADFSPIKNNQVSGIISKKISCIVDLKDRNVKDLANGLSKIFKKLWIKGVRSLNMVIFSGPINIDISNYFVVNLKIISRPALTHRYNSDIGFMELLHQESVVETLPEDVTKTLKF